MLFHRDQAFTRNVPSSALSRGPVLLPIPVPGVDADFDWVVPGLAVGGQPTRQQTYRLPHMGIGAVLSLRAEDDPEDDPRWAERCGLRYQRITVPNAFPFTDDAFYEIESLSRQWRANGLGVLVHCQAGRRRGPIGAAAILVSEGWDVEDAMQMVRRARKQFAPTPDQVASLRRYAVRRAPLRWVAGRLQQFSHLLVRS